MATPPQPRDESLSGQDASTLPISYAPNAINERPQDLNAPDTFLPTWVPASPPSIRISEAESGAEIQHVSRVVGSSGELTSLIDIDQNQEDEDEQLTEAIVEASPPWLISLVVHMVLIVVLGLIAISQAIIPTISLEATFADSFGEQIEHETLEISKVQLADESLVTPDDVTVTEDPLSSPHTLAPEMSDQLLAMAPFEAPDVGLALSGRESGMKEILLQAFGGSELTEQAVFLALKWLEEQQQRDGAWRLDGPYSDASFTRNDLAATSMALLAFQGAGFTPSATRNMVTNSEGDKREVDYRRLMQRGWKKMLEWQDDDGTFWRKAKVINSTHKLYSQAQATIAICELYGMTKNEDYRRPAQLAVNYACDIQDADGVHPDGGWKYDPGRKSDTSVTGWFVMALQSARMAGLDVPSDVFDKVAKYLDSVTDEGSYYAYEPNYNSKPAMTAEALLCRQYMGWSRDDRRLLRGVDYITQHPIDWEDTNTYYWYYATQVLHHMEGDAWFAWNDVMAKQIPAKQAKNGPEKGSWSPSGDPWGQGGGRLYMTCLCTYMLEVYYRHLPIYSKIF